MKPQISELSYISILYRLVIKFTNVRMIASSVIFILSTCLCLSLLQTRQPTVPELQHKKEVYHFKIWNSLQR